MQNTSFESSVTSTTEFVELSAEDDQRITEREFLDDARDMAAKGLGKVKIVEALRSVYLRNGGSVEHLAVGLYRTAVDVAAQATREVTEALGGEHEIEGPSALTVDELLVARLSPECLVDGFLYCDVRIVAGAGGSGKSTMLLHEIACLAGGAPTLWGREIHRHGPVVYLTGEDSRETIAARIRCVIEDSGMLFSARRIAAKLALRARDFSAKFPKIVIQNT